MNWLILIKEELGDSWLNNNMFRIGASGLLLDIERQLFHWVTGRYAAAHELAMSWGRDMWCLPAMNVITIAKLTDFFMTFIQSHNSCFLLHWAINHSLRLVPSSKQYFPFRYQYLCQVSKISCIFIFSGSEPSNISCSFQCFHCIINEIMITFSKLQMSLYISLYLHWDPSEVDIITDCSFKCYRDICWFRFDCVTRNWVLVLRTQNKLV